MARFMDFHDDLKLPAEAAACSEVRPMLVVVVLVLAQDLPQMALVPDKGAIRGSRGHPPIQRSAIAFMRGVWRRTARSGSRHRRGPRRMRR